MSKLWYNRWANTWNEALPIGNGKIGAMVFSNPFCDRLQINEETLWTGAPDNEKHLYGSDKLSEIRKLQLSGEYDKAEKKIQCMTDGSNSNGYVTFGNVYIEHNDVNSSDITNYKRSLDLSTAIISNEYTLDGVDYKKEVFVSFTENCIVYKFKNTKWIEAYVKVACDLKSSVSVKDNTIIIEGRCPTVMYKDRWPLEIEYDDKKESIPFCTMIKVMGNHDITDEGTCIKLSGPNEFTIIMTIKTGYNGFDKMPISEGCDYKTECKKTLDNALKYSYDELKQRHINYYKEKFDRVSFELDGDDYSHIPTDERIKNVANGVIDNGLITDLFDFGRYLQISSSLGLLPANLQGIWTKELTPPWASNYTTNINLQMNYWCVEQMNLPECHMPLMKFIKNCSTKGNHYGMRGWLLCHNSDIWCYNREPGKGAFAFWQMGGLWLCRHIYEHYKYTNDAEFLKEYYPILVGTFEFLEDWLCEDNEGFLVTAPSASPENHFKFNGENLALSVGCTMDLSIISDFLGNMTELATALNKDASIFERMRKRLKPLRIGSDGRLLEWNEEFEEAEPGHRHISHLYGVYPGNIIKTDSDLENAAKKSLEYRLKNGGGHTGWSNAWIACVFARFKDGEKAYEHIINMFKKSIYPNMLDAHPPFQIDGNFGICAAICECLVQSHSGKIELLPALPKEWKSGKIKGFKAHGAYTVDLEWAGGKIIFSKVINIEGETYRHKV